MSCVANIRIAGGIDVAKLATQLAWLTASGIAIPPWLAVLASELDPRDAVFGRQDAVDVAEFKAFRTQLHDRWHASISAVPRAELPSELEGLLALFDYLYDEIYDVAPRLLA